VIIAFLQTGQSIIGDFKKQYTEKMHKEDAIAAFSLLKK
jgi:hypothetical protein